ncbi:MAG TPA: type II secretion system protein GspC [Polyangiaceae bacterium]|nr:type II secretion system protein GspC [Polyangiaceae bacterium]
MSFEALLKRHFWVVTLLLIAVAAYFQAAGVAQIVGTMLAVDEKTLAGRGAAAAPAFVRPPSTAGDHQTSAAAILSRNPFDSVRGNLNPVVDDTTAKASALPATDDPYHAPACEGGVKVLATAVSEDPAWSFAQLAGGAGEGPNPKMLRQGDEYAGKRVWFVRWDRVWLIAPSSFCQVEMFSSGPPPAAGAAAATPSLPPPPPPVGSTGARGVQKVDPDIASKIQRISATEFNVDRSAIDKLLENQAMLMQSGRLVPDTQGGQTVGMRMYGVRSDTLLGTLGFENGDRLEKINGFDITGVEKGLEAYAKLRTADRFSVTVNRRGQPTTIEYHIK